MKVLATRIKKSLYIQSAVSLIGSVGKTDELVDVISDFGTIQFDIDTGANVTLLDWTTFLALEPSPVLSKTSFLLKTFGASQYISVKGYFWSNLCCENKVLMEQIYVSDWDNDGI